MEREPLQRPRAATSDATTKARTPRRAATPADIAGRLQRSHGNAAVAKLLGDATLQRYVTEFEADTAIYAPPAEDLKESLSYHTDALAEDESDIQAAIDGSPGLRNTMADDTRVPTEVRATVNNEPARSPGRDERGPHIGAAGADEFFIQRGQAEAFEGGHIIPNQVFDADESPDRSGDWRNLVPMSRHMNIEEWKQFEKELIRRTVPTRKHNPELIEDDEELEVTIPINRQHYSRRLSVLANRFGLNFIDGSDDEAVQLYGWIPRSIGPITVKRYRTEASETESERELDEAEDTEFRREYEEITTGADLADALAAQGWNISDDLLARVRGLV